MANEKEYFINLSYRSKSRFDMAKFLEYTDNFDPLTSTLFRTIKSLPEKQKFFVQSEEGRPDLISFNIYRDSQYWWVILLYNDLVDCEQVTIGRILSAPNIEGLEDLFFSLRSKEVATT